MIKVSKEDSIIDVIIKIKHVEEKEIVLEFPFEKSTKFLIVSESLTPTTFPGRYWGVLPKK